MEGVRARDAAAFERLYDEYHRLVYGIALRVLSDVRAAEDVTQAVFLKIWSSPETFKSGNFAGWIARVARNRAIDVLRDHRQIADAMPAMAPADVELEDDVARALDGKSLRDAMSRLPHEQREVIELGFFGGLSHDQIAKRTGLPLGTVKTRIRSGLRKLRDQLGGVSVG